MTQEQRSIASAYVISALVGGVYLISWLTHVWGDQPWPINSNMVNYAVVLVLFGVSLLLFGNLFARILPQELGSVTGSGRLTSTHDTSSAAGHHFHKLIICGTVFNCCQQLVCICQAGYNSYFYSCSIYVHGCLFDSIHATHICVL